MMSYIQHNLCQI